MNKEQRQAITNYTLAKIHCMATREALDLAREAENKAWQKKWKAFMALRKAFNVDSYDGEDILVELITRYEV